VIGRPLDLEAEEVRSVLDPRAIVATRKALGGAAPQAVDAMTEEYLAKAVDLGYRAKRELEKYAAAEARLIAEAEQVAGDQHR
jgi:argininosuccinate lyase